MKLNARGMMTWLKGNSGMLIIRLLNSLLRTQLYFGARHGTWHPGMVSKLDDSIHWYLEEIFLLERHSFLSFSSKDKSGKWKIIYNPWGKSLNQLNISLLLQNNRFTGILIYWQ